MNIMDIKIDIITLDDRENEEVLESKTFENVEDENDPAILDWTHDKVLEYDNVYHFGRMFWDDYEGKLYFRFLWMINEKEVLLREYISLLECYMSF